MLELIQKTETFLLTFFGNPQVKKGKIIATVILVGWVLQVFLFPGVLKYFYQLVQVWPQNPPINTLEIIQLQHQDLSAHLRQLNIPQEDHRFKMTYRLFLPLFSRVVGIEYFFWKILLTQLILLPLFVRTLYDWLGTFLSNVVTKFYLLVAFSTTYLISSFWLDIYLYGDSLAFFLVLVCLRWKHPAILFLAAFCAAWIDERAFVSLGSILLWWGMIYYPNDAWTWKNLLNKQTMAVLLAILVYLGIRFYLHQAVFPKNSLSFQSLMYEYLYTLYENIKLIGFSLWRGYKGFLGSCLLFLMVAWQHRLFFRGGLYLLFFSLSLLFAMGAYDLSRSMTYFFPYILFSIVELRRYWNEKDLNLTFFFLLIFTILCSNLSFLKLPGGYALF